MLARRCSLTALNRHRGNHHAQVTGSVTNTTTAIKRLGLGAISIRSLTLPNALLQGGLLIRLNVIQIIITRRRHQLIDSLTAELTLNIPVRTTILFGSLHVRRLFILLIRPSRSSQVLNVPNITTTRHTRTSIITRNLTFGVGLLTNLMNGITDILRHIARDNRNGRTTAVNRRLTIRRNDTHIMRNRILRNLNVLGADSSLTLLMTTKVTHAHRSGNRNPLIAPIRLGLVRLTINTNRRSLSRIILGTQRRSLHLKITGTNVRLRRLKTNEHRRGTTMRTTTMISTLNDRLNRNLLRSLRRNNILLIDRSKRQTMSTRTTNIKTLITLRHTLIVLQNNRKTRNLTINGNRRQTLKTNRRLLSGRNITNVTGNTTGTLTRNLLNLLGFNHRSGALTHNGTINLSSRQDTLLARVNGDQDLINGQAVNYHQGANTLRRLLKRRLETLRLNTLNAQTRTKGAHHTRNINRTHRRQDLKTGCRRSTSITLYGHHRNHEVTIIRGGILTATHNTTITQHSMRLTNTQ